jgi:perosamine synthetase
MLWQFAYNQSKNIVKLLIGRKLTTPSLGSMTLDKDDVDLVRMWLRDHSSWGRQEIITQYETQFAHWNGTRHSFAFMGGRVALSACIYALDLRPGDEVILPGYTCVVVPNAFQYAGIETVYCDIELDTYGLDVNLLEKKITSRTKAILLQHLYGLVCRDYEAILELAQRHRIKIIEDCAHATGAIFKSKKVGNYGDVGFYSSEQSKIFNTIQGGIAVTNDDRIARKLREYYLQASFPDRLLIERQLYSVILNYYQFKHPQRWWWGDLAEFLYGRKRIISTSAQEEQGIKPRDYGRRMSAPIAAVGLNQLSKIDFYNECRRKTAKRWDEWCEVNGYKKPSVISESVPVYLRYPVMVEPDKKRDTSWARREVQVSLGVWYVSNIHPTKRNVENCPNADRAVKQCVNFPCLLE